MPAPGIPTLTLLSLWNVVTLTRGNVSGATGYRYYRKPNGDPDSSYVMILDGPDVSNTFNPPHHDYSTGSNPLHNWTWAVTAYNDDGESGYGIGSAAMTGVTNSNANSLEQLHPSYNDGSDKTASYSDISKSGSGGASDDDLNAAALYYDTLRFQEI